MASCPVSFDARMREILAVTRGLIYLIENVLPKWITRNSESDCEKIYFSRRIILFSHSVIARARAHYRILYTRVTHEFAHLCGKILTTNMWAKYALHIYSFVVFFSSIVFSLLSNNRTDALARDCRKKKTTLSSNNVDRRNSRNLNSCPRKTVLLAKTASGELLRERVYIYTRTEIGLW